jgi:hypothetical protein
MPQNAQPLGHRPIVRNREKRASRIAIEPTRRDVRRDSDAHDVGHPLRAGRPGDDDLPPGGLASFDKSAL